MAISGASFSAVRLCRIKLAFLTFKALHSSHPPYLPDLLQYHKPTRSTRSSSSHLLSVPRHNLSFLVLVLFVSLHAKIWNSLPRRILQSQTLSSLSSFSQPILPPSTHPQCALIFFWDFGPIYTSCTYLLTYTVYVVSSTIGLLSDNYISWCTIRTEIIKPVIQRLWSYDLTALYKLCYYYYYYYYYTYWRHSDDGICDVTQRSSSNQSAASCQRRQLNTWRSCLCQFLQ